MGGSDGNIVESVLSFCLSVDSGEQTQVMGFSR